MKLVLASLLLSILGACAGLDVRGTLLLPGGSISYYEKGGRDTVDFRMDGKQVIDLR
jgi:hypothetical protein